MSAEPGAPKRGIAGISREGEPSRERFGRHASNVVDVPAEASSSTKIVTETFTIFAAMPFDPAFDDVFFVGVQAAAHSIGGHAIRVDQVMHGTDAVAETQRQIRDCRAVVADVSTSEPDVLYELGFAQALGKPSVQICCTSYDDLPFMVRNRETILYHQGRTHLLGRKLAVYLAHMLGSA